MLAEVGVLSRADLAAIEGGLATIRGEIERGEFVWSRDLEDVHFNIERRLTALIGDAGKRLHTARSRNDQVATDLRLWLRESIDGLSALLAGLRLALIDLAERHADTIMPGFTHLQVAQPVTFGHHLLAWVEMLDRDRTRFAAAASASVESPLGAGALAGSTLPLAGPPGQMRNSIDAVADRDFALDYLYAVAVLYTHLSRIGEELVLWSSGEFGFAKLPESAATGSSMAVRSASSSVRAESGRVWRRVR